MLNDNNCNFVVLLSLFTLHLLLHLLQCIVCYSLKSFGPKSFNIVKIFTSNLCLKDGRCKEYQILKTEVTFWGT